MKEVCNRLCISERGHSFDIDRLIDSFNYSTRFFKIQMHSVFISMIPHSNNRSANFRIPPVRP
jgi:hypothetical protein